MTWAQSRFNAFSMTVFWLIFAFKQQLLKVGHDSGKNLNIYEQGLHTFYEILI
jgi:hypothetical protein